MEKYNFIGKNLTEENKEFASRALEKIHGDKNIETDSQEYREPTKEELFNIIKAKNLISEELKRLEITPNNLDLNEYQFKFLKNSNNLGSYDAETRVIEISDKYKIQLGKIFKQPTKIIPATAFFIKKLITKIPEKPETKSNYRTILHESIHSQSFHKYELGTDSDTLSINIYRNGYLLNQKNYFRGFNEGIVDKITREIEKEYGIGGLRILASMDTRTKRKDIKNFLYYIYFSTKSNYLKKFIEKKLIPKNNYV